MISRVIGILIAALLMAGAVWAVWPRPVEIEVTTVAQGDLVVTIDEDGIARIREVFRVTAPVGGRLVRVNLHAGDPVKMGETVATIEPAAPALLDERSRRIASAAMEAAEAAVTLAETSLAQAKAQLAYAQADVLRKRTLAERGLISQQIEDQVELAAATAQKNVDLAEATLTIREQDLTSAQANLMEGGGAGGGQCCAIVASPAGGEILSVMTESEQVVQPGTPILEIGDPTDLEISVEVLSSDAVRIEPGASAPALSTM
jgi:HlyD family secretion protein